jgi:hypothetical protein
MKRKSKQTEKQKKLLKSTSNDSIATLKNEKELSEYLVVELRELLKDLGLDTKGKVLLVYLESRVDQET